MSASQKMTGEITNEELVELRKVVAETGDTLLGRQLTKLLDSYEMVRVHYETAEANWAMVLDQLGRSNELLKEERARVVQLRSMLPVMPVATVDQVGELPVDLKPITPGVDAEAIEAPQVVVLRAENWQRAVDLLSDAGHHAEKQAYITKALELLTRVDDGRPTEPSYDTAVVSTPFRNEDLLAGVDNSAEEWPTEPNEKELEDARAFMRDQAAGLRPAIDAQAIAGLLANHRAYLVHQFKVTQLGAL